MKRILIVALMALALTTVRFAPASARAAAAPADLDALLAPAALYPDQLLAQMFLATANPSMIGALSEWLRSQTRTGSELQAAAAASGFADSLAALALFPDVVDWMAARPDWTAKL